MGLIITSVIISIIIVLGIVGLIAYLNYDNQKKFSYKWCLCGFLFLLIILFGCVTSVGANTVGIIYNPFKGGIQDQIIGQGFKLKSPVEEVYKISTEVQEFNFENISVQTNDSQFVNTELQVQLRLDSAMAFEYFKKYGNKKLKDIQSIISNTTQQKLEKVSTQYNIMEILGEKRDEIISKTLELVKEELIKDGILVERIILIDTDAGDDIEKAIADEAVAKKNAEAAEYTKQKAQLEGDAKVIEAQKQQEANDTLKESLTTEILTQKFIEKWDGKMSEYISGDALSLILGRDK